LFRFLLRISLLYSIGTVIIFSIIGNNTDIATIVQGQVFLLPSLSPVPSTPSLVPLQSNTTAIATPRNTTSIAVPSFAAHGIRITSPTKGQKVPIGSLIIVGTSKDNTTTACQVFVIVNGVKPYQNASAIGPGGASDYSKWNFILTSKYTLIKEGPNKITAKFSCKADPSVASFYSVDVIGTGVMPGGLKTRTSSTTITTNSISTR
jgi:hypothetical protein